MTADPARARFVLLTICLCACLGYRSDHDPDAGTPIDPAAMPLCIPLVPLRPECFPRPRPGPRCALIRSGGVCETLLELPCGLAAYPAANAPAPPCDAICRGWLLTNGRPISCAVVTPATGTAGPIVACRQPCD